MILLQSQPKPRGRTMPQHHQSRIHAELDSSPTSEPVRKNSTRFVTSNLVFHLVSCLASVMLRLVQSRLPIALPLLILAVHSSAVATVTKPHIIAFGKWTTVQWSPESGTSVGDDKPVTLKVRPLLV